MAENAETNITLDAGDADSLTLPEGFNLSEANFEADGQDLVVTGPDGAQVTVEDYYAQDNPPDLTTPEGGQISGEMVAELAAPADSGSSLTAGTDGFQIPGADDSMVAGSGQVIAGTDGEPIGNVENLEGTVWAIRPDGTKVELDVGDPVYQGDILESSEDGAVGVLLADETTFSMAENGRMVLDEMIYDPATQEGSVSVSVVQGVFTFVSGQVAKTDPDAMAIDTPVATIGIRGTQVGIEIPDGENLNVVLMEEADGFVGEVVVMNDGGAQVMNGANQFTVVRSFDTRPGQVDTIDQQDMVENFATALENLPLVHGNQNDFGLQQSEGEFLDEEIQQLDEEAEALDEFETAAGEEEPEATDDTNTDLTGDLEELELVDQVVFEGDVPQDTRGPQGGPSNAPEDDDDLIDDVVEEVAPPGMEFIPGTTTPIPVGLTGLRLNEEGRVEGTAEGDYDASESEEDFDITGSEEDQQLATGSGDDVVRGGDGVDIIDGGAGNDFLDGGEGNDFVAGGEGDDVVLGSEGNDVLSGGAGNDTVSGGQGDDTVLGGDLPEGSTGIAVDDEGNISFLYETVNEDGETVVTAVPADDVEVGAGHDVLDGGEGDDIVVGGSGDDIVSGGEGSDVLAGGSGADTLEGGTGDDVAFGGSGNDQFIAGLGNDQIDGGAGVDTVTFESATEGYNLVIDLAGGFATDATDSHGPWIDFDTLSGIENVIGGAGDDVIIGGLGNNVLDGGAGDDRIEGMLGNDHLIGGEGDDTLDGGFGNDLLEGGTGANVLIGGAGSDTARFEGDFGEFSIDLNDGVFTITMNADPEDPNAVPTSYTVSEVETFQFGQYDEDGQFIESSSIEILEAAGVEDTVFGLDVAAALGEADLEGVASITLSGIPEGTTLTANGEVIEPGEDGLYTLTPDQIDLVQAQLAEHSSEDFFMQIESYDSEGNMVDSAYMSVNVAGVADTPQLEVDDVVAFEDAAFALNIDGGLVDTDGSETLSLTISGAPVGGFTTDENGDTVQGNGPSTLSATVNGETIFFDQDPDDRSFTIEGFTNDEMAQIIDTLQFTAPLHHDEDFTLEMAMTATEADGDTSTSFATMEVDMKAVADVPDLDVVDASGLEDGFIDLDISAAVTDPSETLTVTLNGLPEGTTVYVGFDTNPEVEGDELMVQLPVDEDGSISIPLTMLDKVSIKPPEDSNEDFDITVIATSTEPDETTEGNQTATAEGIIHVSVEGVADPVELITEAASGTEDLAIPLSIETGLEDIDGSETLTVTISGVPEGAELSAGTENNDGTWTLSTADLDGLTITPPLHSDEDFTLSVNATTTENDGDSFSIDGTIDVSVAADADAPTLTLNAAQGDEDTAIALDISSSLVDADGSETLSVTISDIPEGAVLSAGTLNEDGSVTLTPAELEGLTITPPADSNVDFDLTVTATTTEANGGDTAETVGTLSVDVVGVADDITLAASAQDGDVNLEIPLDISSSLSDVDGSETLSITIEIPEGSGVLSAGTLNEDGSYTLTPAELEGLTFTPNPRYPDGSLVDGDLTFNVTATTTEDDGDTKSVSQDLTFNVDGHAEAPTLEMTDAQGLEDTAIALDISSSLTDLDGSESLSITIDGIPEGATLTTTGPDGEPMELDVTFTTVTDEDGNEITTGSVTIPGDQQDGLEITPPADSNVDFSLGVTATSAIEGGDIAETTGVIDVDVIGVADTPDFDLDSEVAGEQTAGAAEGLEDTLIPLDIQTASTDTDGSETLSISISGIPAGGFLKRVDENGNVIETIGTIGDTATLSPDQLVGLVIQPPANSGQDFTLDVTATTTEDDGDSTSVNGTIDVTVIGVPDAPSLMLFDAQGLEDSAIPLNFAAMLTDDEEALSVTISDIPEGATLTMTGPDGETVTLEVVYTTTTGADGQPVTTGEVTIPGGQPQDLMVIPPEDSNEDFDLTVTATSTTEEGDFAETSGTISVDVIGVADAPNLDVTDAEGDAGEPVPLDIGSSLNDTDGSETLTITISNIPDGSTLNNGTLNPDGSYTLTAEDLEGLTISPPTQDELPFTLHVESTVTENDGDTVTVSDVLNVTIDEGPDAPIVTVSDSQGFEDTAIPVNIDAQLMDVTETLSITIDGVPEGATLSAGTLNEDGTYTLTQEELNGLTVTPAPDSNVDFDLQVTVTSTDDGESISVEETVHVDVVGVADDPTLSVADTTGDQGEPTPLNISSALTDTDGSETLSITISNLPDGASLNNGTLNADGSYTLTSEDLSGLTLTVPADYSGTAALMVTSTATENDGDSASTVDVLDVVYEGGICDPSDPPTLVIGDVQGDEDTAIPLNIDAALTDGTETLSVTISDIPDGAVLSAGTVNPDGTVTLTAEELDGLTITPPADSNVDFDLSVTATSTNAHGESSSVNGTMTVDVIGVADMPTLVLSDAAGSEDTPIPLDISSALTDTDGSETLSLTISDVPEGATLSAGTDNGDGSWTLTAAELDGLTITPAANSSDDFTLSVTATSTENDGDTASNLGTIDVSVDPEADAPILQVSSATGDEDTAIPLDISAALTDASEVLAVTISNVPDGATLSAGVLNDDGSYTLTPADLDGLTVTPPADSNVDFDLSVTATSTEENGEVAETTSTLSVDVIGVADAPTLSVDVGPGTPIGGGVMDIPEMPHDISNMVFYIEDDAGNVEKIKVEAFPGGEDGIRDANDLDLAGFIEENYPGTELVAVSVKAGDNMEEDLGPGEGELFIMLSDLPRTDLPLDAHADETHNFADVSDDLMGDGSGSHFAGTEFPLNIESSLTDTDGSESLSLTVSDLPDGVVLSSGTVNADGSVSLTPDQLEGLTMTVPAGSDADFDLTVTATSTEDDGDSTSVSETVGVGLDTEAEAPDLTVGNATGDEDSAIALNIDAALIDTDGSESLTVTISGVPDGGVLSSGINNGDGTWTLGPGDLEGLTVTPPADSNVDFNLTVTATSTEAQSGDTASTTATLAVDVVGVADTPEAFVFNALGNEDSWTQLNLDSGVSGDTDGSETLSITISGVPEGALLSPGVDQGDGVWSVTPAQLPLVCIRPHEDFSGDLSLTLNVTSTENDGDTNTVSEDFTVTVTPDADGADLNVSSAAGLEDTAIALDIGAVLNDTDGSETLSVTIGGVPQGATLSAGALNPDGTYTLSADDLEGLTVTPGADSNVDFNLSVTATTTEQANGDTSTVSAVLPVSVTGVADAPTLSVELGEPVITQIDGEEVSVSIGSDNVTSTDAGFTVVGRSVNPDGTLSDGSADNLSFNTSPPGFGVAGSASGANSELGFDAGTGTSEEIAVSFDEPIASADVAFAWMHTGEEATYEIFRDGVKVGEGTVTGVTDSVDDPVTLTAGDGGTFDEIVFSASGTGDDYLINSIDFQTVEGGSTVVEYPLDITSNLTDTDGSETLSVTIDDLPDGVTLSAGTVNGDGSVTLTPNELSGLTVSVPGDSAENFSLSVSATSQENDGDTATVSTTVSVDAGGVDVTADGAALNVNAASGAEDSAIDLDISAVLNDQDGSETLSVTIGGVPAGATLSAGTDNGDGSYTLTPEQLDGLTVTPPANSNADFSLSVTATTTESASGDTASTTANLAVDVVGVADEPEAVVSNAFGDENEWIQLDLSSSASVDTDGSETLSITITGVPEGALLNPGSDQGDGVWSVTPAQLPLVCIRPVDDFTGDINLTLNVTMTENDGDTNTVSEDFTVSVADVDDTSEGATVNVTAASGLEDTAIDLDIGAVLNDQDGSETLSLTISGVPNGASLSAGTVNPDGSYTLTPAELSGLTVTPPDDSNVDFNLTVTATTTETNGGATATTTATVPVAVTGDADAPTVSVVVGEATIAGDGNPEPVSNWKLDENDGFASQGQTITDAMGNNNGAVGEWGQDLDDAGQFGQAAEFESYYGDVIEVPHSDSLKPDSGTLTIRFNADSVSGDRTLASSDSSYYDDGGHFNLEIDDGQLRLRMQDESQSFEANGGTVNANEWNQVTVTWGEDGMNVYLNGEVVAHNDYTGGLSGNENPWTFGASQMGSGDNVADNLYNYFDGHMDDIAIFDEQLSAEQVAELNNGSVEDFMNADGGAGGGEATIPLDITANLTDTDGSETLSVTVSDLPDGATLSAGTVNPDGSVTLTPEQLNGLTLSVPGDTTDDFNLTVTAKSEEDDGDTATTVLSVPVDAPIDGADAPDLDVTLTALGGDTPEIGDEPGSDVEIGTSTQQGGSSGDSLDGGEGGDTMLGLGGDDDLDGKEGDDLIDGGSGDDELEGGEGADILLGGSGNDELEGEEGNDALYGGTGDDELEGGEGSDILYGGSGDDQIDGNEGGEGGEGGDIDVAGFRGNRDEYRVTDHGNGTYTVVDLVEGRDGTDTLVNIDTLRFADGDVDIDDAEDGNPPDGTTIGGTSFELEINGALTDLDGSESLNISVSGLPDGASLSAGTNNGDGSWTLEQDDLDGLMVNLDASVTDSFDLTVAAVAEEENGDTATELATVPVDPAALAGDQAIAGDSGDDTLVGGDGDDVIEGGAGDDQLTGGAGQDEFMFGADTGHDVVTDIFEQDTLVFDGQEFHMDDLVLSENEEGDVVIAFQGVEDSSVTLDGVSLDDLQANDGDTGNDGYSVSEDGGKVTITIDNIS